MNRPAPRRLSVETLEDRVNPAGEVGLRADLFAGTTALSATTTAAAALPAVSRVDAQVNFKWARGAPAAELPADNFSVRWTGQVRAAEGGACRFRTYSDDGVRLWVNGALVVNAWNDHAPRFDASGTVTLAAGQLYDIRLDDYERTGGATARLEWDRPDGTAGNYQTIPTANLYPFSKPITITVGGTYVGSWESTDPNQDVVRVSTSAAVTVANSWVRGRTQSSNDARALINANTVPDVRLTLVDNRIQGLRPFVAGGQQARAVNVLNPRYLTVEHNTVEGTTGVRVLNFRNHPPADFVRIRHNDVRNLDGRQDAAGNLIEWVSRRPVGGGPTEVGSFGGNFVQLNRLVGQPNVEIAWNQVVNAPFHSTTEDVISVYESGGTADSPLRIHNNYIQGSYTPRPDRSLTTLADGYVCKWTHTGSAIVVGDNPNGVDVGRVRVFDDQAVSVGNIGIGIAGGHDAELSGNRVVSSGRLPDGRLVGSSFTGLSGWDFYAAGPFSNNVIRDNVVGWNATDYDRGAQYRNDYEYRTPGPGGSEPNPIPDPTDPIPGVTAFNNQSLPGPVTLADEAAERAAWEDKLSAFGVLVGDRRPLRWNARSVIQAEDYNRMRGVVNFGGGVGFVDNGDFLRFRAVDFGPAGAAVFRANVASGVAGTEVQVRVGSPTGALLGTLSVPNTGGFGTHAVAETAVAAPAGVQDVYLDFTGAVNVDWFTFA